MRLLSFLNCGQGRLGIELDNDLVFDANRACLAFLEQQGEPFAQRLADALLPSHALAFLQGGTKSLGQAHKVLEFVQGQVQVNEVLPDYVFQASAIKRLAPIPNPQKIVCVGRNYHDHVAEMKRDVPTIPVLFAKLGNTVCGHQADIPFPRVSDQFDYEAELAVVIGKKGRYIAVDEAMSYVAGYTAMNDITVRDWQHRTPQWLQGKSFDNSGPMGPVLITADEILDPHQLDIQLWLNGELRQSDNTRHLIFDIPALVSFISQVMTLEPGDVIATGTPGGVGVAMQPQGFMKIGDVVRIEIEKIGVLENHIVAP
ncbi:fumarylacetoacetate hydrolase family protein [Sulfoacidibacillus thermotolerans]|uniref:2-hydroxyhepta-2,4-diene-1,7-dioate isomerase n=1 Tax=Sulfoacidibacillus thermotolerans TaxID=1765684 RepID=A0A2U3D776_SULT2|nr:fumarylacetoacetate hydrolase family protein [Sulfoacidibacillus thermotolerans]PWI57127.1 2-hydroxyhepta-2,4-diene-1,7-dioate isomerase [Sulfoacidibacillus thermotolerans]